MRRFSTSVFLYIAVFITSSENSVNNSFKLFNIKCSPVENFIRNATCTIKASGREKFLLNMDCYVVKPLNNVTVTAKLYKFFNGYRFLQGLTINACDILSKKKFHPLANIAVNLGLKFTNINHTCPFSGHIFVRNGSYTPGVIESLVPSGKYKGVVYVFEGYPLVSVGTVEVYANVEELPVKH